MDEPREEDKVSDRTVSGKISAVTGVALSTLFLLNLTMGVVEIPDNLPIIGNIDEVIASGILFSCLGYLGVNVLPFQKKLQAGQQRK